MANVSPPRGATVGGPHERRQKPLHPDQRKVQEAALAEQDDVEHKEPEAPKDPPQDPPKDPPQSLLPRDQGAGGGGAKPIEVTNKTSQSPTSPADKKN